MKIPEIRHIACDGPQRNAIYTFQNTQKNPIILSDFNIVQKDALFDTIINIDNLYLTTCIDGGALPGYATCNINLTIAPEACISGPMTGDIDKVLNITINQQEQMNMPIMTAFTTLGAGEYFALIGSDLTDDDGYGPAFISGDTGFTEMGYTGTFFVSGGKQYLSSTFPEVMSAQGDFLATFLMFNEFYLPQCTRRGALQIMK